MTHTSSRYSVKILFFPRTEMFRVLTRSLDLYRRRHAGRSPRRVMVHKNTEFKRDEVDGAMEALHLCEAVDLLQVVENVGWRGVRIDIGDKNPGEGQPTAFPVSRGTVIGLSPREALLWTHGDVQGYKPARLLLPRRPEYPPSDSFSAACWSRTMGRNCTRNIGTKQDELE